MIRMNVEIPASGHQFLNLSDSARPITSSDCRVRTTWTNVPDDLELFERLHGR